MMKQIISIHELYLQQLDDITIYTKLYHPSYDTHKKNGSDKLRKATDTQHSSDISLRIKSQRNNLLQYISHHITLPTKTNALLVS